MSSGSRLGVRAKTVQKSRLPISSLPGDVFVGLRDCGNPANNFHQLREKPRNVRSNVYSYRVVLPLHSMGEATLHAVASLSSLQLRSAAKESRQTGSVVIVTSVLVPLLIAGVPLVTDTYKPASPPRSYCYIFDNINDTRHIELAEKLGLWDGPAMIMLMAASIFMVVLVIRVTRLLWRKLKYEPIISSEDRYWTALKELLPLTAFPILFFIFLIPLTILHIYTELNPAHDEPLSLVIVALLCISLWSFASGMTLIIHLSLARRFAKKKALESRRTSYTRSVYGSAA